MRRGSSQWLAMAAKGLVALVRKCSRLLSRNRIALAATTRDESSHEVVRLEDRRVHCRCDIVGVMWGDDSERYAYGHLHCVRYDAANWVDYLVCGETGWRWSL